KVQRVDAQRLTDIFLHEAREGSAVDTPDQLADDKPEGIVVIAGFRTRLPLQLQRGDARACSLPVCQLCQANSRRRMRPARGMRQALTNRDGLLAIGAEGGPVRRDRGVIIELATFSQQVDGSCGDALPGGRRPEERPTIHWRAAGGVHDAGEGIDYQRAVLIRGYLQSELRAFATPAC